MAWPGFRRRVVSIAPLRAFVQFGGVSRTDLLHIPTPEGTNYGICGIVGLRANVEMSGFERDHIPEPFRSRMVLASTSSVAASSEFSGMSTRKSQSVFMTMTL